MKIKFSLLLSILLLVLISCDDSKSSGLDYSTLCTTSCEKDESCNLLDNKTVDECVTECEDYSKNMLDSFFEAYVECKDTKTCTELQSTTDNSGLCYDDNIELCVSDTSEYLNAACTKILECDGNSDPTETQLENCKENMHGDGNVLRCYTEEKLSEVVSCINEATSCTPNPVNICVEDILGISLGGSGTQN